MRMRALQTEVYVHGDEPASPGERSPCAGTALFVRRQALRRIGLIKAKHLVINIYKYALG